jgi:hypothetical protein
MRPFSDSVITQETQAGPTTCRRHAWSPWSTIYQRAWTMGVAHRIQTRDCPRCGAHRKRGVLHRLHPHELVHPT